MEGRGRPPEIGDFSLHRAPGPLALALHPSVDKRKREDGQEGAGSLGRGDRASRAWAPRRRGATLTSRQPAGGARGLHRRLYSEPFSVEAPSYCFLLHGDCTGTPKHTRALAVTRRCFLSPHPRAGSCRQRALPHCQLQGAGKAGPGRAPGGLPGAWAGHFPLGCEVISETSACPLRPAFQKQFPSPVSGKRPSSCDRGAATRPPAGTRQGPHRSVPGGKSGLRREYEVPLDVGEPGHKHVCGFVVRSAAQPPPVRDSLVFLQVGGPSRCATERCREASVSVTSSLRRMQRTCERQPPLST